VVALLLRGRQRGWRALDPARRCRTNEGGRGVLLAKLRQTVRLCREQVVRQGPRHFRRWQGAFAAGLRPKHLSGQPLYQSVPRQPVGRAGDNCGG